MDNHFITIVQKLMAEQGKETLLNVAQCKAFLADYTRNEYKKESHLLITALEAGASKAINTTGELAICKLQQVRYLREDCFLEEKAAVEIVEMLAFVLRGDSIKIPLSTQSAPQPVKQEPQTGNINPVTGDFVFVSGGTFQMGNAKGSRNKPVHTVHVSDFYMGTYTVTQKEWLDIMGSNPSYFKGANLPVENISWYDAVEYCNKRSLKEGLPIAYRGSLDAIICDFTVGSYRLPTEAEWEYAAKGGNKDELMYEYAGSNNVDNVGWYANNSGYQTHPVGSKAPNSLGLYDMSGNVWEWCWDWYGRYTSRTQTDPLGASSGSYRVERGGGWYDSGQNVRSAYRGLTTPSGRHNGLGVRLLRPSL